ncbi:MFS transporter [Rhodococcus sp. Rp3]|uniref:MFS transporter n=1 Tax=Rhodococcus sp. Rp3 TaxID=2807635 RepID=UPI00233E64AB|nr:MFS transporter [Rhodococcus sp. Rp3]MDC3724397.1 MHS family MFS transporter [Rhodococcus sp. Rp3]
MRNDANTANTMVDVVDENPDPEAAKGYRRVLMSSFLGSAIEYYDFLLYATAATLVFGPLFFQGQSQAVALLLSFATFAVGYIARPLGGIIFGSLGDRIGRKTSLFTTMLMMGIASTAIGLLPTAASIGALAPILLVIVRIVQGLAVGGEWGGAALMALEHAPKQKRGFGASMANMGGPAGGVLAVVVYSAFAAMPEEQFMSWGWRIPFLLSAVLVAFGLFVRMKVAESPVFVAAQKRSEGGTKSSATILVVLRKYPRAVAYAATAVVGALVFQTFFTTFAISITTNTGMSATAGLLCKGFGSLVNIFAIAFFAHLSDRVGRRRVLIIGSVACMIAAYPLIMLFASGNLAVVLFGFALGNIVQASIYGPVAAYVSELFETRTRNTGAGVSYQLGAIIGGFTPLVATSLWQFGKANVATTGWAQFSPVGLYLIAGCLVTLVSVSLGKETKNKSLDEVAA